MKQFYSLLLFLLSVLTLQAQPVTTATAQFNKLSWLTGTWNRINMKPGSTAQERWKKTADYELKGMGVMLKQKDTAFVEKLMILIKDEAVYYVADVKGNKEPVYFKLTEVREDGFVCENAEHDFPKKIDYTREGNRLKVVISGNGKAVDYWFERK